MALLTLAKTVAAFELAHLSGAFSLVGALFAQIGGLLARVGLLISLISNPFACVCCRDATAKPLLLRVQLRLAHLNLGLAALDVNRSAPAARPGRGRAIAFLARVAPSAGSDQVCPAALQSRACVLIRRRIAMEVRALPVALLLPERCRPLMRLRRLPMTSFGLLVTPR